MKALAVLTLLLGGSLAGCAGTAGGPPPPYGMQPSPGNQTVASVGTPFLLALKIPVCIASVAVAGPVAAVSALTPDDEGREIRSMLGAGVERNCGPPYTVSPWP
jgi:hypothetical protein